MMRHGRARDAAKNDCMISVERAIVRIIYDSELTEKEMEWVLWMLGVKATLYNAQDRSHGSRPRN